jgi:hypothetical protein
MSRRRVHLILLCEDRQHEAFFRRFFERSGWNKREIQVRKAPKGRGSGEQWIRGVYSEEVKKLRSSHVSACLVAAIDEDKQGLGNREKQFATSLEETGQRSREQNEPILHLIPARNIETWIAYLDGESAQEESNYPKLKRESDCAPMVKELRRMCDEQDLRAPAPPSLERACREYRQRIPTR